MKADGEPALIHAIQPSSQQVGTADAGVAAARLHKRKARLVAIAAGIIVAAVHTAAHHSRAAAGRNPQAAIAETKDGLLHRDIEPFGDPADLLPERRRVCPKRAMLGANVEPRRQPHFLAEKRLALARLAKALACARPTS